MIQDYPICRINLGSLPRTGFLFSKSFVEAIHLHFPTCFLRHQLGEVDRETICVVEFESECTVDDFFDRMLDAACLPDRQGCWMLDIGCSFLVRFQIRIELCDPASQCSEE